MQSSPCERERPAEVNGVVSPGDPSERASHRADPLAPAGEPLIPEAEEGEEAEEPSELDDSDSTSPDGCWDVFIADDDERDPLPEAGDFWASTEPGAWSDESD